MAAAVPMSLFSMTDSAGTDEQKRKSRLNLKPAEFTASLRRFLRRRPVLGFSPLHVWWDKAFPVQSKVGPTKPANHFRLSFPVRLIVENNQGTEEVAVMYHRLVYAESRALSCFIGQPSLGIADDPTTFIALVCANKAKRRLVIHNEPLRNVMMSVFQVHSTYFWWLGLEGGATSLQSCPHQAIAEILAFRR
eukprot:Gregarina_sp_Poly_1__3500@NODE_2019_length_2845_cov_133_921166_g1304_i0_p3_GENE_NODE_2019_length_2845_cov_133_921166_g1304_i0NODE_2019_length_2845_cov_133_921166_g1304_i0_p3_ORF_typecomplete_len192_score2_28CCT_2/PF09425_10/20CCT_2/PF09425_10/34_NODE_2019_length_2845_cov_133_921166_g1304_i012041779